ncbi:restriction endonuclease subunit S [Propionivibrio sp.]|uniref:restriction endonuclease subunit S n=1 Tax=Propionivibrio sp. TaxID=2212460 RepID=UPI003BF3B827
MGTGTTVKGIRLEDIRSLNFPLAPLPEQKRIADKLDTLLARIENCRDRLDRVPIIIKQFRQSVLKAATSGRLTEDWRNSRCLSDVSSSRMTCLRRIQREKTAWLHENTDHNEAGRIQRRLESF